jgi:hypothetical protein
MIGGYQPLLFVCESGVRWQFPGPHRFGKQWQLLANFLQQKRQAPWKELSNHKDEEKQGGRTGNAVSRPDTCV